jgi:hypothetical protein
MIKTNRSVTQSDIGHIENKSVKDSKVLIQGTLFEYDSKLRSNDIIICSNAILTRSETYNRFKCPNIDIRSNKSA